MNHLVNALASAAPSAVTAFARLWFVLLVLATVPLSALLMYGRAIEDGGATLDHFGLFFFLVGGLMVSFAIPVAIVAAIIFVLFGGLTR
jgi:hypothetical protein